MPALAPDPPLEERIGFVVGVHLVAGFPGSRNSGRLDQVPAPRSALGSCLVEALVPARGTGCRSRAVLMSLGPR